jgi:3'-phosphoadenosine 5'-phosphosulfate sulfotransferase (PAPS reductase)/FAD synthetase
MEYIASISYGKDSLAMLEIIKKHNMPLDRIVHVEIMATDTIPADLPPMVEFKDKADKIIKARYGIEVEHIHVPFSYEERFYKLCNGKNEKFKGKYTSFPGRIRNWCNSELKVGPLKKLERNATMYIGIAADEPNRFHNLNERKISPLVEWNISEREARFICQKLGLLSPIYTQSARGGCWFCHNQSLGQLRLLRKQYPEYWALMLKWDNDSIRTFHADGTTVHDLDKRFEIEDSAEEGFYFKKRKDEYQLMIRAE